ncbi:hypothetical protein MesoLjLc_16360 [Mesorhizobium sp. L-8-10]|uniref:hypothetical protein n=1 Tax=unclassified Mesorhizobium TaxID=325217 RepID=UPI001926BFE7|nr:MULTISPECIES: hypothetical protein [unclassified Mesorhizobium]BCH22012.1 hypothetical protein MesoLjLb_17970 [Mesorhizobium sp. L-8-3]BCH29706.1 hypothetical protein MesoLjLc_16360 [Mesorhizobium sp. L-8-10]
MRRFLLSAILAACCCFGAEAGEITSTYTDLDTGRDCTTFAMNAEEGQFANMVCNGYRGYPVIIYSADLRESVFYGFPPAGDLAPTWESFAAFNSTGPKVEWRIEENGDLRIPFATIHRWSVSNPEDPDRQVEVLVVAKVGQIAERDGCVVGLVMATGNTKANETARRIADEQARGFACGADERVLVGGELSVPEFQRQEN